MKKLTIIAIVISLGLFGAGIASAQQNSATESAVPANATIIAPLAIEHTAHLQFGGIVTGLTAGTVILTPANDRSSTGGVTLGNSTGVNPAGFHVTGAGTSTFGITYSSDNVITKATTLETMAVGSFTDSCTVHVCTLSSGALDFTVGATLTVGTTALQPAGLYEGTFDVTVTYE